jgi:hypothetical protein
LKAEGMNGVGRDVQKCYDEAGDAAMKIKECMLYEFSPAFESPEFVADWTAEPSSRNSSIQRINGRTPDST